jgi:hypothetical protein
MASPWLYVRDSPWDSYIWGRSAHSKISKEYFNRSYYALITRPMGYKWGNDATGVHVWANYNSSNGQYSAKVEYEIAALGENDFYSAWKTDSIPQKGPIAVGLKTPTGTPEYHNVITISNKWHIKKWLFLDCGIHTRFINNLNHVPNSNIVLFEPWVGVAVKFTSF